MKKPRVWEYLLLGYMCCVGGTALELLVFQRCVTIQEFATNFDIMFHCCVSGFVLESGLLLIGAILLAIIHALIFVVMPLMLFAVDCIRNMIGYFHGGEENDNTKRCDKN